MKILQVGKFYPIRGGVEKVMYDLMLGLSEAGVRCDMLCASTEDYPASTIELNDYAKLIIVPTKLKLAATMLAPSMIMALRKIAKQYDIIHIHHPDPMASLALFFSGYKGKVVLHWHSDILKQKTLLKLYKPLQRWLIKRADSIVGTTPVYVQQSSFLSDMQHKVDYIPIGVQAIVVDTKQATEIRQRYNDKKLIFSLGRLVEYKGYEYLIRAAQLLSTEYQIVIGGKGPLHDQLQQLILQLGVQDRVELIGFVSDEALPAYYGACDVFCLSSIWKTEAFAIVQIEAMSCAKPIISTDIPGSGVSWVNATGQSGAVVEIADPQALADAMRQMMEDKVYYETLSIGSLNRYQMHFTREKMVDKCLKVYDELLSTSAMGKGDQAGRE
jgi:glycosyltransferase involved in cell wall biosynthesis